MISLFPNLIHLDDRYVTDDQRREADRMYKRPLLERIVSKAPPNLPNYLRSVSEKVTGIFTAAPNFTPKAEKNCIIWIFFFVINCVIFINRPFYIVRLRYLYMYVIGWPDNISPCPHWSWFVSKRWRHKVDMYTVCHEW